MFRITANLKTFFAAFALAAVTLAGAGTASAQQYVAEQVEQERRAELSDTATADKTDEKDDSETAAKRDDDDAEEVTLDRPGSAGDTII